MTAIAKTRAWPTLNQVEGYIDALADAYNQLDRLSGHGLIDQEDPWEIPSGTPRPTLEDVGVLTRLIAETESRLEGINRWLDEFRQLRDAASTFEAQGRGARA